MTNINAPFSTLSLEVLIGTVFTIVVVTVHKLHVPGELMNLMTIEMFSVNYAHPSKNSFNAVEIYRNARILTVSIYMPLVEVLQLNALNASYNFFIIAKGCNVMY